MNLKYLVVGTGRCGTVFMSRLLTNLGIMCGHEAIFNTLGIEHALTILDDKVKGRTSDCSIGKWYHFDQTQAESSYMAVPFLNHPCLRNTKIIHIVRDPLKVISSFHLDIRFFRNNKPHDKWSTFVYRILPELKNIKTPLERACYFYVKWNDMIEHSDLFLKIEEQPSQKLFDFLEITPVSCDVPTDTNSWKKRDRNISISEIPDGSIKNKFLEKIEQYQYNKKMFI